MATGGSLVLTVTPAEFWTGVCTGFSVNNGGVVPVLINIEGLHEPDEWLAIAAGTQHEFVVEEMGILAATGKTESSAAVIYFGITILSERR